MPNEPLLEAVAERESAERVSEGPSDGVVGLVDGSAASTTRRFQVVLDDQAVVQLDDLVTTSQVLADGRRLRHFGIVVEGTGQIEGAELPSDTRRIAAERTMPGVTSRRVEVQVLRTVPELWIAPEPGAAVRKAVGADREAALFLDQMERPIPVGLDQDGQPVHADFCFLNGEKGGHVSISGVSGVATKTSYALFLLYVLFETEQGKRLLGQASPNTRSLVFNVKGEDLLHLDRPNSRFRQVEGALDGWRSLGVEKPGPFRRVRFFAPRAPGSRQGSLTSDVVSRDSREVTVYGWTPERFVREGLLRFCFAEEEDYRNQVSFVEQRVRTQLARWAFPLQGEPGALLLAEPPRSTSYVFDRAAREKRAPRPAGDGFPVRDFGDLIDFLTRKLTPDQEGADRDWAAGTQGGTCLAFLRRLYAQVPQLGHLIAPGVTPVTLEEFVNVVDIHGLHDSAQRFVVGALLSRIFEEKQGQGREPLRFIVLDELNKYAPKNGRSPIKDVLVDIAARGRSLGVLLIGAQQSAADVDGNLIRNAALKVAGRLDAGEASQYRFLSAELRERAARFLPGTMVLDQPLIPAPIPLRFPFPAFATNVAEGRRQRSARQQEEVFEGV